MDVLHMPAEVLEHVFAAKRALARAGDRGDALDVGLDVEEVF
jgi:hypothetical protein